MPEGDYPSPPPKTLTGTAFFPDTEKRRENMTRFAIVAHLPENTLCYSTCVKHKKAVLSVWSALVGPTEIVSEKK